MAAGLPTPKSVHANGWLLFDQGKMSKSKGNVVRAETVQAILGADALRYFLLREIPFGQDGNFSFDAMVQRYNGDLANGYGNLVSRVVNMVHKYFGGTVPTVGIETEAETALRASAEKALASFGPAFDAFDFSEALKSLWVLVAETDGYLTANAPWKKPAERSDEEHTALQARVLVTAAEAIRVITALVYPILPASAEKVWRQLGQGEIADASEAGFLKNLAWGGLKPGTQFAEPAPLFPRAEKNAAARMIALEDENSKSVIEAASTCGAASGGVAAIEPKEESVSAAKAAGKGTTVSEISKEQKVWEQAPVDSVGVEPEDEAKAYETVAAAAAPAIPPVPEGQSAPPQVPSTPAAPATEGAAQPPSAAPQVPEGYPPLSPQITIDDVVKLDLRVAQIIVAERIPKADKLLRLEVNLGYEKRQILAGIAQYYAPETLVGRKIVIVANLAPRKMRGLESNGMLLAASLENSSPVLAGFLEEVPLGARLK
jgi:methionyl-tRNA synthetase